MRRSVMALSLAAVLALSSSASAAAPGFMPVQGFLTDAEGQPVDGEVILTFRLWDDLAGGQVLFTEVQAALVENGFFTLYLGAQGNPVLDLALFRDHGALYLGLQVGTEAEMAPRLPLGAVPYAGFAQHAGDAQTLAGHTADEFRLGADAVGWDDLSGVPDELLDGDADSLARITCQPGQVVKWAGNAFACAEDLDTDTTLDEQSVDAMVANNGYVSQNTLAPIAFSGAFGDLQGVPQDLLDGDADTLADLDCGGGQLAKWNGNAWECASDVDTDTDTAAPGTEHRTFGGLSWTAPFGGTVAFSGYSAWLRNGFAGSMPYIHALPVPAMFAGRGVTLDGVNVWYACSAGSIDASTVLSTDMPGSYAALASSTDSHPGSGGYYLPVGADVAGLLFLELVVTSPNASDACSAVWRASYRY